MFSAPFLVTLLDRVKAIVRRVVRPGVARPVPADTAETNGRGSPTPPGLAQEWMSDRVAALWALMRRMEAGATRTSPAAAPRNAIAANATVASATGLEVRTMMPPEDCLPRGFGWMCGLGPNVRRDGQAFAEWLSEPATRALMLTAPERMARLIGPILTATGVARPAWFPARAKHSRRVRGIKTRSVPGSQRLLGVARSGKPADAGSTFCGDTDRDPDSQGSRRPCPGRLDVTGPKATRKLLNRNVLASRFGRDPHHRNGAVPINAMGRSPIARRSHRGPISKTRHRHRWEARARFVTISK